MSGGGTEYRLIVQTKLMVLPTLMYTADSPCIWACAAVSIEKLLSNKLERS